VTEHELLNSDKAIQNLLQEKQRLLKRRQELSEPNYLLNLKRDLKTTEQEIKQQLKLKKQLAEEHLKRDRRLDHLIAADENEVLLRVQDVTQRLALITDQIAEIDTDNAKAR